MTHNPLEDNHERILAIYPNSYGFGFALMQGSLTVIDKGIVRITPMTNAESLVRLKELIKKYEPERVILEDFKGNSSFKCARVKQLIQSVIAFMKINKISYSEYSREQIRIVFDIWNAKTRYEIAEVIVRNIPKLRMLFFEKPKYPRTETYHFGLFDAVSLGICHYYLND